MKMILATTAGALLIGLTSVMAQQREDTTRNRPLYRKPQNPTAPYGDTVNNNGVRKTNGSNQWNNATGDSSLNAPTTPPEQRSQYNQRKPVRRDSVDNSSAPAEYRQNETNSPTENNRSHSNNDDSGSSGSPLYGSAESAVNGDVGNNSTTGNNLTQGGQANSPIDNDSRSATGSSISGQQDQNPKTVQDQNPKARQANDGATSGTSGYVSSQYRTENPAPASGVNQDKKKQDTTRSARYRETEIPSSNDQHHVRVKDLDRNKPAGTEANETQPVQKKKMTHHAVPSKKKTTTDSSKLNKD
jgi:hypothetical protein